MPRRFRISPWRERQMFKFGQRDDQDGTAWPKPGFGYLTNASGPAGTARRTETVLIEGCVTERECRTAAKIRR
jgi:hypothetical protein